MKIVLNQTTGRYLISKGWLFKYYFSTCIGYYGPKWRSDIYLATTFKSIAAAEIFAKDYFSRNPPILINVKDIKL